MAQTPYRVTAPYRLNLRYDGTAARGVMDPTVKVPTQISKNQRDSSFTSVTANPRTAATIARRERT